MREHICYSNWQGVRSIDRSKKEVVHNSICTAEGLNRQEINERVGIEVKSVYKMIITIYRN